jgi:membrane protein YdbS with pleckstrin-like domain
MTPLDPRHLTLLRLHFAVAAIVLLIAIVAGDLWLARQGWTPPWLPTGIAAPLALLAVLLLPGRRYRAWGYDQREDELLVKHGRLIRQLTVVPFGRVQHIDIAQGPLQRALGLATLVLNTAGTRGAAVKLPGLRPADAEAMRDHIRAKIRQDLL